MNHFAFSPLFRIPRWVPAAILVFALGFVTTTLLGATTQDWPRFRGPNGSGISDVIDLPVDFGPNTNLAWRVDVPAGISSPVVMSGRVYLTAFDGDRRITLCFDLNSGRRVWERSLQAVRSERKSKPNDPAASTPAIDATGVYAFFSEFGLVAYSLSGEERWRRSLGPFNPPHGMASSPILAAGNVILLADQVTGSHITAFDLRSGKENWRTPRGDYVGGYSTPVLTPEGEIVVSGPIEMIAYAPTTGQRRWSVSRMGVMPVSSPVCAGNHIYAYNDAVPPFEAMAREMKRDQNRDGRLEPDEFPDPSFKEAVRTIDRVYGNGDGAIDQKEWDGALRLMNTMNAFVSVRLEPTGPAEQWRNTKFLADAASPLLYKDVLFLIKNGGVLSSMDPASGAIIRQERIRDFPGDVFASPVGADGKIFIVNAAGKVAILSATREWETFRVNDLREPAYATPAIADSTLLIRTEKTLWAFRNSRANSLAQPK